MMLKIHIFLLKNISRKYVMRFISFTFQPDENLHFKNLHDENIRIRVHKKKKMYMYIILNK